MCDLSSHDNTHPSTGAHHLNPRYAHNAHCVRFTQVYVCVCTVYELFEHWIWLILQEGSIDNAVVRNGSFERSFHALELASSAIWLVLSTWSLENCCTIWSEKNLKPSFCGETFVDLIIGDVFRLTGRTPSSPDSHWIQATKKRIRK